MSKSQVRRNRKGEATARAEGLGLEHRGSVSTHPYCLTVCGTCSHRNPSVCPRIWPPSAIGVHQQKPGGSQGHVYDTVGEWNSSGGAPENAVRLVKGKGSEVLMFIFMALPTEVSLAFKTKQDPREFEWREVSIRWIRLPQPDRGKRVDG